MFFLGVGVALVFEGAERGDDFLAGGGGLDDGVDVALVGGDERIGEAFAEFGDFFLAQGFALGFWNFFKLTFVNDVDGAFRSHDCNFRGGPGEVGVGADVLAGHDAIGAAVGFAGDDGDFRDGGLGKGEEEFCAVADDAAEFLLRAGQKAGNVFEGNGMLKASQKRTKRAPFVEALISRTPARKAGWLATMPTGRPSRRAKPTTRFFAKCSWTSKK